MSKSSRILARVAPLVVLDMFLAAFCFVLAYMLRVGVPLSNPVAAFQTLRDSAYFHAYVALIVAAPFVRVFTMNLFGAYGEESLGRPASTKLINICKSVTLGTATLILISFLYRGIGEYSEFSYSRLIFAMDWLLNLIAVSIAHASAWGARGAMLRRGIGCRRLAIQGAGEAALNLMRELQDHPDKRYRVAGFIANDPPTDSAAQKQVGFEHLGSTDQILDIINEHSLDEIVVTNAGSLGSDLMTFVEECHKRDVLVKLSLDFYGVLTQGGSVEELAGQPVVQVNEIGIVGFARLLKRIEDVVLTSLLLVITFPLWVVIAALIKRESPGPILFHQRRVGKNGRTFTMYKFRSMTDDAEARKKELDGDNEAEGHIFKMKDDPRVTSIGRFIRATCIDELPQFFNVLKGEMSLVGPRPPVPYEVVHYAEQHKQRLATTPGITGLWQVNRGHQYSFDEILTWDTYYIENWSLWLDLKIIVKTVWVMIARRGY